MRFNQRGVIFTLNSRSLKLVDKFTNLGSSISPTKTDINTRLAKAWTAKIVYQSYGSQTWPIKWNEAFFQAAVVYGCTTRTLTKRMEKKLKGNYTRMLRAILNKYWMQHPTKQQLYGHVPPITKPIQVRRDQTCFRRSRDELISDVLLCSCGTLQMDEQRQDNQVELTYNTSVLIRDVTLRTRLKRSTIEKGGRRGLGISVLIAWHDIYIYIYIYNYGMIFI